MSELQLEWQGQLSDLVTGLVCSPNGRGWAASSAAGEIIWNAGLMDSVELHAADDRSIERIAFSADSRWLAAGGQAGELLIWNCDEIDRPPQLVAKINFNKWIEHLVWHPTESCLAIGYGSQLEIWDILKSESMLAWKFEKSSIFDLAWHPAGVYLAVAGYKGVQIWAPRDRMAPTHTIDVDTASLKVAWAEGGRYLAAGNLDRTLTIVDWHNPTDSWTLKGCPGKIRQLAWIAGTTTPCLAVASGNTIVLWNLTPDETSWNGQLLEGHQDSVEVLAAHPHAPIFGSGSADGYTCLWSAQGESDRVISNSLLSRFTALAWHPDRAYLGTGSQSGEIGLWQISA
ncbi:WD40 repeat domain-containing protein [Chamaesiphon sp. VAR_48_metabat_135_sub]|uniref:WD40 repeat domain-containing protein n=1 Tax=Chamaesiphon sp. VAR_48_metabat_135_sub TaxID=2964699 RepID=UPI00286D081C|nr:WD40 repeat domain-containing protein [Chamaesiphon sp. VAR_48_metabat_135_sub]